jgi:sphingosine kinase
MAIDLISILQDEKRSFSFLSQGVGLMADLDLGTEHLRWMGNNRFVYGFLRGSKYCPSAILPSLNVLASPNSQGVSVLNLCKEWSV